MIQKSKNVVVVTYKIKELLLLHHKKRDIDKYFVLERISNKNPQEVP